MHIRFFIILLALISGKAFNPSARAQYTRYIIQFRDKANSPFSIDKPIQFLSQKAIDRRNAYAIIIDSLDLPINPSYVSAVRSIENVRVLNQSKWLNQISIETSDPNALIQIRSLPFINAAMPVAARHIQNPSLIHQVEKPLNTQEVLTPTGNEENNFDYGASNDQIQIHHGSFLHNHGFRGDNMLMALLDDGFYNYNSLSTFDSLRHNNLIKGTWDFVAGDTSVSEDDAHGTWCLSAIGANNPGLLVGTAPLSSFYLFRTEDVSSEYPIEEHNLAVAAEKSDSLGVDVCSISLGYNTFDDPTFDYTYSDLNGNKTISARASNIAAQKGMLMVIAAGNEGSDPWKYITTPGDAEKALTVGAVNTNGEVAFFSGFGPAANNQIKPNVAAVGANAVVANAISGQPIYINGTSFACPNMAGLATCLWQAFPEANNMDIIDALQQSASKFNSPDERVGYGIPDMKKAFVILQKKYYEKNYYNSLCKTYIDLNLKTDSSMKISLEKKLQNESRFVTVSTDKRKGDYGLQTYHFTDDIILNKSLPLIYRIKVDIGTDTSYYIDEFTMNYNNNCISRSVSMNKTDIFPNPLNDRLIIQADRIKQTDISISIYNSIGQMIFLDTYKHLAGRFIQKIDFSKHKSGIYFVRIMDGNKTSEIKKIIKQ
ncbi:MAG: T9SS type A sorting domain-containing protein [Ferruginibacter sp.]|nr:T9SS type A sorting domain-containing protein [Ferruginibacter sp.]